MRRKRGLFSRWVRRFNQRGIDGLTEGPRSGRPPKSVES
ncbi:MAG: helix-turn-helix domain-containing protein [Desulfomonilaceae bacterium]